MRAIAVYVLVQAPWYQPASCQFLLLNELVVSVFITVTATRTEQYLAPMHGSLGDPLKGHIGLKAASAATSKLAWTLHQH